jgi:hypothetical protein
MTTSSDYIDRDPSDAITLEEYEGGRGKKV